MFRFQVWATDRAGRSTDMTSSNAGRNILRVAGIAVRVAGMAGILWNLDRCVTGKPPYVHIHRAGSSIRSNGWMAGVNGEADSDRVMPLS